MQCRERRQSREMKAGQSEAPRNRMEVVESIQDFLNTINQVSKIHISISFSPYTVLFI